MNQIWQMWSEELDRVAVDSIIKECETYQVKPATVGHIELIDAKEDLSIRRSELRWVSPSTSPTIAKLLWNYIATANRNAFGVDITNIWDIQYTVYKGTDDGHYDWHHDTFWGNASSFDRKLSIIIQLSDPADYEGGKFEIDPQYENPNEIALKKQGSILVFPSTIRHRVLPVTSGVRKSLVAWVEGPKWR